MHREGRIDRQTAGLQVDRPQVTGWVVGLGWFHREWPRVSRGFRAEERRALNESAGGTWLCDRRIGR